MTLNVFMNLALNVYQIQGARILES